MPAHAFSRLAAILPVGLKRVNTRIPLQSLQSSRERALVADQVLPFAHFLATT